MKILASIKPLSLAILACLAPSWAMADEQVLDNEDISIVTIIGTQADAIKVPGSAHVVSEVELEEMKYSDATRALQRIPGLYIQQEDGLGLRPNIGIRGSGTERSGRISLMEDGVLIAPAPYAASSAYYFPTFDRMQGIEVLKGAASIKYGPFTTGGAVNFISRQIPLEAAGQLKLELGQDGQQRGHIFYGDSMDNFAYLIEANKHQYDGFKTIDRSNDDTGFDKDDYLLKLRFNSDPSDAFYQQLDLKIQHSTEASEQTYLGLTEADYAINPYRQYGLSELDNFAGEHDQYTLSYSLDFSDDLSLGLIAYRNETARNWFKTEALRADLSNDSIANPTRFNWASVINEINASGINSTYFQSVLNGADTTAGDLIEIRSNNREYLSRGIQLNLNWGFAIGETNHELEFGLRRHKDQEDRLQRNSFYTQQAGDLVLDDIGILGNAGNRLQTAEATSVFLTDTISIGNWILTPGLRHEDIDLARQDWGKQPLRDEVNLSARENSVAKLLPGFGALYQVNDKASILFGVNKGFAPPGNDTGDQAEESINYELGLRFANDSYRSEFILFANDYDNLLGECSNANSGCDSNNDGDKENGGKALVQGFELTVAGDLAKNWPARLSYTYTKTEFESSFDSDVWGEVLTGNAIPYIPENVAQLALGYDNKKWSFFVTTNYVSGVCTKAACSALQQTDNLLVMDLSSEYQVNDTFAIYASIDNLLEEEGVSAREPYGARPVKSRHARIGVRFDF